MKKLLSGLLCFLMVVSLGACSSSSDDASTTADTTATDTPLVAEGTTVTIWHTFTDDQKDTLEALAQEFNETNEYGITVNVESQAYDGFTDMVKTNVYNGQGPDMILNYASTAADYIEDELVVDLGKYIDDPEIGIEDYASSLPEGIYDESMSFDDGKMHIMITQTTGPVLFYNKTLYDELSLETATTWDQLAENAKAIYEAKGIPGVGFDSLTDTMQALIMQAGSGYIDVENKEVLWNNEDVVSQLEYISENTKAGYFAVDPTNNYFSSDFNASAVGGFIGSVAGLPYVDPEGTFEFDCAAMPLEGNGWNTAWDRGLIAFDYGDEDRAIASYLFMKFFVEPENSKEWVMSYNALSPYYAVNEDADYQAYVDSNVALKALSEQIGTAGTLPNVTGSYNVRTELESAVRVASHGEASAADALNEAAINSNQALKGE